MHEGKASRVITAPDLREPTAGPALRVLDLLARTIREAPGLSRDGGLFETSAPWVVADYGQVVLGRGWWVFEIEGEGPIETVELRLRSSEDALLPFSLRRDPVAKVFFHTARTCDVSLLVSAWPARLLLKTLRLRRLTKMEEARLAVSMLSRLARSGNPVAKLVHVATRVLGGHSLRIQTRQPPPIVRPAQAVARTTAPAPAQSVAMNGMTVVLREGERLHPRAIALVTDAFARAPSLQAIYADLAEAGEIRPRPDWDADLAAHAVYAPSPIFFRGERAIDDPWRTLRDTAMQPGAVARIPLPLATSNTITPISFVTPPVPVLARTPTVSIIIPTKIRIDLLERCLAGLAERTDYPALDVVIVNNGAEDPRFADVIAAAASRMPLQQIDDFGPFNFSRLINAGAKRSRGEILLLLNDDVEAIAPGWLHRIVASAMDPAIGCVGARLLYADRTLQHAGVTLGVSGVCGHLWRGLTPDQAAATPQAVLPSGRMAVTGACLAIRRDLFERTGGLDAENFPVAFNDIDLCLRIATLGYRTLYRGDAALIHHESQSRGLDHTTSEKRQRLARETRIFLDRWGHLLRDDPFGSPAFDPTTESGAPHASLLAD